MRSKLDLILDKNNAVLIEKNHNSGASNVKIYNSIDNKIFNIENHCDLDTQELLLISDVLITDYSSCYMDYLILNRPIIHFAYDYKKYKENDQGFYYDLNDVAAGQVIINIDSLFQSIKDNLQNYNLDENRRENIKNKMLEYEEENSCTTICKHVGILK